MWHLFDTESIESLLLTAHPDGQRSPQTQMPGRSPLTAPRLNRRCLEPPDRLA
ncbi:hypothetical protein VB780_16770 [Leptolyngbya sp. CCNP1308]|uniref:hypothetical protein n=1 Tax=Leptolyngbya sp. CCNP1308 TaxID=3110255 RepID=UPI002B20B9C1|nr:hypothetical protein [Leptolyngbya sp. CCNP1308]MEA5450236.1 hypothetical protein [Leptolyngbya sp. CCNP1308]